VSAARSPFFAASRRSPMIFWPLIRDGAVFAIRAGCYHEARPVKCSRGAARVSTAYAAESCRISRRSCGRLAAKHANAADT